MIQQFFFHLLLTYKYPILVPFAFVEGHIVSLIVGFLAKMGLINPFLGALCIMAGNLIGDVLLYYLGYHKGEKFVKRYGKRFGVTEEKLAKGKELYHSHKSYILLLSKLTNGFGLSVVVLLAGGISRINFREYMMWNVIGEAIWTSGLVALGYFLGSLYESVDNIIFKFGLVGGILVVILLVFLYYKNYMQAKMNV